MREYSIRFWKPEDKPALKALWQTAFGDSEEYIDRFFQNFLQGEDACVVADVDGKVVSAMYIVRDVTLFPYRKKHLTAGYTYALATLPEYRGRGIGSAVYKAAGDKALETADAACVLPAEEGLYPFYENASGARPLGCVREARFTREELAAHTPCMAARLPALEYSLIREQLLSGLPHAMLPEALFDHLEADGVEYFVLEHGVAAAETQNGVCRILELLDPDTDGMSSVAGVARWCRAEEYIVRSPLFFDGPGTRKPFMLAALKSTPDYPIAEDLWWGFGMD